jgi:hypothetical protein
LLNLGAAIVVVLAAKRLYVVVEFVPSGGERYQLPSWRSCWRAPVGIVFNEHTPEDGALVFRHACKMGLEGIVSKRLTSPYRSGPSRDWIEIKNPDSPAMRSARAGLW